MGEILDVAVVGAGPAGCTAALYCARAGFTVAVLERLVPGGQVAATGQIDNYPGFPEGIDGFALGERMADGARRFGAAARSCEVTAVHLTEAPKRLETTAGEVLAHTVVLAGGAYPRTLGLPEEETLRGKGVSYCATCDGMLYRGRTAVVVGGGNSAVGEALHLERLCRKVCLVHRRDKLTANRAYLEDLTRSGVEVIWNSRVSAIRHRETVTGVELTDVKTHARREVPCDGVFVAIGRVPDTELVRGQVTLDERGYVASDETTRTNLPGVFAVGDLRQKPVRQIVTAVADGAVCAKYVEEYMMGLSRG